MAGLGLDVLKRVTNVRWPQPAAAAALEIGFFARPTGFYKDDTPHVATLSVAGLPPLTPSTFKVNLAKGIPAPPFYDEVFYGGSTSLTVPDGEEGVLSANWFLEQGTGADAGGTVSYISQPTKPSGTFKPFMGENNIKITVNMILRPLDFLSIFSGDNHYEWTATGGANIPGITTSDFFVKTGRAESGGTLIVIMDVTMKPPSATFSARST